MTKEKRILHLINDEKFLDYFIEQSETVAPQVSEYWVLSDDTKDSLRFIKSALPKSIKWTRKTIKEHAQKANGFDKIVLHSFFFSDLNFFLKRIRKDIEVIWVFWGGDGYSYTSNEQQWYLPLTWLYKRNIFREGVSLLRSTFRTINMSRIRKMKSRLTCRLIKRVNTCATWIKYDYEMILHINPKMEWRYYSYYTTEQLDFTNLEYKPININRLWLGNSATDTNNHLDALDYLNSIQWQGEIVVPLSYGSTEYRNKIIEYGVKNFGEKFTPLVDFIPLEEYHQLMNSCGIVWMNHIRQQAAGNILAALYMGKVVIMNSNNNLYKTLKEWQIHFETQDILTQINKILPEQFLENKGRILYNLARDKNLVAIARLYI